MCILYTIFFIPVSLAYAGPGNVSLPGSSKVVIRKHRSTKTIFDQVGTRMNNGFDPRLQAEDQTKLEGIDNPALAFPN